MTADRTIAADGVAFFQNMLIGDLRGSYGKLLVAPVSLKQTLLRLIDGEIARGDRGRHHPQDQRRHGAGADRQAGGGLPGRGAGGPDRPGHLLPGARRARQDGPHHRDQHRGASSWSTPASTASGEGALRQMYLSSADIMTRNQERRVEIACPVESREVQDFLSDYLARLLGDNVKARRMLPDGGFVRAEQAGAVPVSVQQFYLDHPPQMRATERGKGRGWRLPELFRKRK